MDSSRFLIVYPNGNEIDIDSLESLNKIEDKLLRTFSATEVFQKELIPTQQIPPHIKYMKKLEMVDYEPASDVGHMRFYPAGTLVKDLLEDLAYQIAVEDLKAMKIKTPILYNLDEPDIREQALAFHEKDYKLQVQEKTFLLKFAGDFGLFRMMKDAQISYNQLPVRVYEIAPSFRLEQSGEVSGLRRLRAFTMPDIHSFCRDIEQGKCEFRELHRYYDKFLNTVNLPYTLAFRTTEDFWRTDKQFILELVKISDKPAFIELLGKMKHYWILKQEFQYIDSQGKNAQLSTVQLDVIDGKRYGINYIDSDGNKEPCIIIHSSMGSLERWMYALLEEAHNMKLKGLPPSLPVWLSPTQIRLIPVSHKHLTYCDNLSDKIESNRIRVDIDDRNETVEKRIRDAETSWVPYILAIGDNEVNSGIYKVRVRTERVIKDMTYEQLIEEVTDKIKNKPYRKSYLPRYLSKRIKFR